MAAATEVDAIISGILARMKGVALPESSETEEQRQRNLIAISEKISEKRSDGGEYVYYKLPVEDTSGCAYGLCNGSSAYPIMLPGETVERWKECPCAADKATANRLRFANIPAEFESLTIKSFETDRYSTDANRAMARNIKKIVIQYVKNFGRMRQMGKGLYLYGETRGSGKTRLAVSIGNALISQNLAPVKFVTTTNLLEEIKATWDNQNRDPAEQTQSKLLAAIKDISVLILDDIGVEKSTPWVNETFYNILNDRMTANKVTVFTSNCRIEDLRHDSRIVNRILKMAMPIKFPDESIRTAIAMQENEDILKSFLEG